MEIAIGIFGIFVSVALYFAGVRQGRKNERADREHDLQLERMRQEHERTLEEDRRRREIISMVADEYVTMARQGRDNGPHALARIGLENLGSDADIRLAIDEMRVRAGGDPWAAAAPSIEDIDLVAFFSHVRAHNVDLWPVRVAEVAQEVRNAGDLRPR